MLCAPSPTPHPILLAEKGEPRLGPHHAGRDLKAMLKVTQDFRAFSRHLSLQSFLLPLPHPLPDRLKGKPDFSHITAGGGGGHAGLYALLGFLCSFNLCIQQDPQLHFLPNPSALQFSLFLIFPFGNQNLSLFSLGKEAEICFAVHILPEIGPVLQKGEPELEQGQTKELRLILHSSACFDSALYRIQAGSLPTMSFSSTATALLPHCCDCGERDG